MNAGHEYPSSVKSLWEPEISNSWVQTEAERGVPISAAFLLLVLPTLGYPSCLPATTLWGTETSPGTM